MTEKLLYSRKEAAAMLSVSLDTVHNMILRRELKPCRVGRRVLIPRAELIRFTQRDHVDAGTKRL